jgi:diadenosine tetraphosphatase ApaH/serine/threonine PP2A family protein phosphatase
MRLALLTDIHANREAFTACLAHAESQKADQYAFTGDFVGYGADPAWVIDKVMQYVDKGAIVVQGNHDIAATREARPSMHSEAREVIEWTRGQLSPEHMQFLAELPLTREKNGMLFVHASANNPSKWQYVTGVDEAETSLFATDCKMVFSGHVHAPALYRRTADGKMGAHTPTPTKRIPLNLQNQYLVIPGSVGQPRDANNAACYAIYDDVEQELSFFRVQYDYGAAARRVIASGLPIVFAMRLIEGI